MKLLDEAQDIASQKPLPKDAEGQMQSIMDQAKGHEKTLIGHLFEALIVARSKSPR